MSVFHSYMWSVPDWRTDEMYISLDNREQGIYRNLIDECWVAGSIIAEPELLARFVHEPLDYFLDLWAKLRPKFKPIDGGKKLISPRLEQDRRRLMLNAKFNEKRARKAAQVRWNKERAEKELHAHSTFVASTEHAVEHCQTQTQTHIEEETPSTRTPKPIPYSEEFKRFWSVYPRRVGKANAWVAWRKNHRPPLPDILDAVQRAIQSRDWQCQAGRFIPHPATWLNQHRWEDEGLIPMKPKSKDIIV